MDILSKFSENLKLLMTEQGVNPPALAKILNTDRTNVTRYLRAERLPLFDGFVKILDYFNVSADVMLGLCEYVEYSEYLPVTDFSARLKCVMKETNTSQYSIERTLGVSGSSIYNWLHSKTLPSVESLVKLANYMQVSLDYLLGRIK